MTNFSTLTRYLRYILPGKSEKDVQSSSRRKRKGFIVHTDYILLINLTSVDDENISVLEMGFSSTHFIRIDSYVLTKAL